VKRYQIFKKSYRFLRDLGNQTVSWYNKGVAFSTFQAILISESGMKIALYTVEGFHQSGKYLGLLPGIDRARLPHPEIGQIMQGTEVLLTLPDGETRTSEVVHYFMRVPDAVVDLSELDHLGIILVLAEVNSEEDIPVGTKISLESGRDDESG
tara:strand:+ start:7055 stop:7513 length:459 start_codon:yes stop_codon:yes gene_type:complete